MVLTRADKERIIKHILEGVLDQDEGSRLHKAFEFNGIKSPYDIVSMSEEAIMALTFLNDDGAQEPVRTNEYSLVLAFRSFTFFRKSQGNPIGDSDWMTITMNEYDQFRISIDYHTKSFMKGMTIPIAPPPKHDPVHEFRRGIKRDITYFTALKDDAAWDNWNRTTIAQARAQDVADVLDSTYKPTDPLAKELFVEKQKYMYAVFERTLLTDKGKALVRQHQATFDAQKIYSELSQYALQSTKATMDASTILSYLTTAKLGDGKWNGTTHAFILHWQDQVRKYHDLSSHHKLPLDLQRTMLENAVHNIPELRSVKIQAAQHKTHTGLELTYQQYCSLLLSAAQQHDKQLMPHGTRQSQRRHVYMQDISSDLQIDGESLHDIASFDIDSSIDTISAYNSNWRPGPRLTREQWHKLPDDAKKTWDLLSDDAKKIILQPPPPPAPNPQRQRPPPTPPRRHLNEHDIQHLVSCLHDLCGGSSTIDTNLSTIAATSEHEATTTDDSNQDQEDDNKLLAHVTNQKKLPPGDIKRLLSQKTNSSSKPREVNINGVKYREVNNVNINYKVSSFSTSICSGALVDRGANGGIAGADTRIIHKTGRQVDVQGIDNHQMVNIPIVTAGAVVNTQKGEVIVIMNQYAYPGKGKTIHSSPQLEAHKQIVHDKARKVGGQQHIQTLDGYIIPLNIRSGLPYMTMRPFTNKEWDELPHVILTADTDWDPSILDDEQEDNEEWFNALEELPSLVSDPLFDEFGDYRLTHQVTEAIMADSIIENSVITDLPSTFQLYASEVKPRPIDIDKFKPRLAWLPDDIIEKTFEKTTQFYRMPASTYLKKTFKSPFPACNVHRRNEPVATDTVYADTPAIDDGAQSAQFFVGCDSLVCDVYGMKTDKQFVNTLQDNIRRRGAMNKLISDRAQVEVSKKVQDILRNLIISDWQSEPHQQQQNPAERRFQDVKRMANTILDRTGAPPSLWLQALMYVCLILNLTANASLNYAVPYTVLTGVTPDISALLQFEWYEPVYYREEETEFPSVSKEKLGWFVGVAEHVGHAMTYKVLTKDTSKIIFRSVIRSAKDPKTQNKRAEGDIKDNPPSIIRSRIDDNVGKQQGTNDTNLFSMPIVDPEDLIGRTFLVPTDDGQVHRAKIVECVQEHLDKTKSEHLRFRCSINNDKYEEIMSYNDIITYLEKDAENPVLWKFKKIVSHQGPIDKNHPDYNGSSYNVRVEWENGELTDEPLAIIAADDPVTCAIYARDKNLLDKPGWQRFRGIAKRQKKLFWMANQAKLRSFRTAPCFKYGYQIPPDYIKAMELDSKNKNKKWHDATELEMALMKDYSVFLDKGKGAKIPEGYKKIRVHLIYDVKHDGRHRARLVADGHLTDIPLESVYSGVVSLRGLRMLLFIAELNGLETWATDIASAYLEAYTAEKVCIIAGPEFGALQGHLLIIQRALYGLRSSGARWHERLADCLRAEGFKPSHGEPDIWLRPNDNLYEYIAVYVDDLAFAMKQPQSFVTVLQEKYKFKVKGTGPLEFHLGADFVRDSDGTLMMSPRKYIERLEQAYEQMFGERPRTTVYSPLEKGDHPELDDSELLDDTGVQQYQSIIGSLQWAISLGRFDIATAVMSMSSFQVAPRRGHLDRLKRICGYLSRMKHGSISFRTHLPDYSDLPGIEHDWFNVYGELQELVPENAPPPLGKPVVLTHYVDANLFHDMLTGRSVTGIIHLMNGTPIDWYTKKQATVETATYGSEFVAARTCVEQIIDIRTTLRYLGVPICKTSYMFGDNESVVNSSTNPYGKLHKRHTALSFHRVREAVAAKIVAFHYLPGSSNPADIMSKHWGYSTIWPMLQCLLFWQGDTIDLKVKD